MSAYNFNNGAEVNISGNGNNHQLIGSNSQDQFFLQNQYQSSEQISSQNNLNLRTNYFTINDNEKITCIFFYLDFIFCGCVNGHFYIFNTKQNKLKNQGYQVIVR